MVPKGLFPTLLAGALISKGPAPTESIIIFDVAPGLDRHPFPNCGGLRPPLRSADPASADRHVPP